MNDKDTQLGGSNPSFRTTMWSDIVAAGDPTNPQAREHLDRLIRAYWKPVHAYLRAAWHLSIEDAKDSTQSFFTRFLERATWSRIQQERGSFRAYLKAALKYFMLNERRNELTRRPDAGALSIEVSREDLERIEPPAPGESPEHTYDRQWFKCVLELSIADLGGFLEREGKSRYFDVFKAYCLDSDVRSQLSKEDDKATPSYREIAELKGIHHSDVRNYLSYCRKVIRRIVTDRVREYVANESDVEREINEVFGL